MNLQGRVLLPLAGEPASGKNQVGSKTERFLSVASTLPHRCQRWHRRHELRHQKKSSARKSEDLGSFFQDQILRRNFLGLDMTDSGNALLNGLCCCHRGISQKLVLSNYAVAPRNKVDLISSSMLTNRMLPTSWQGCCTSELSMLSPMVGLPSGSRYRSYERRPLQLFTCGDLHRAFPDITARRFTSLE